MVLLLDKVCIPALPHIYSVTSLCCRFAGKGFNDKDSQLSIK